MIEDGQELITKLKELRTLIEDLPGRLKMIPSQIEIHYGLSDLSSSLGTVTAGEFRTGVKTPGRGFSGMRMAYPGMTYNGETWNLVGVSDDVLQFGVRASDGKVLAGGGAVMLDQLGVRIYSNSAGSTFSPSVATERVRLGNLDGFLDVTGSAYGMGIGTLENFLKYTPETGLQIRGSVVLGGVNLSGFDSYLQLPTAGVIDGTNATFTTDGDYQDGRVFANLNGIWYFSPDDYESVYRNEIQLDGAYLPVSSDLLTAHYRKLSDGRSFAESPAGVMDGSNNYFYLTHVPVADTVFTILNGIQIWGSTSSARNVKLINPPLLLDELRLSYSRTPGSWIVEEPVGLKNRVNTAFTFTSSPKNPAGFLVFLNGIELYNGEDYWLNTVTGLSGVVSIMSLNFMAAPIESDTIFVMYSTDDYLY